LPARQGHAHLHEVGQSEPRQRSPDRPPAARGGKDSTRPAAGRDGT
jgi:hypothetical protein